MAIPKAEGRDEFNALMDDLLPKLKAGGRNYSRDAADIMPSIDQGKLQMAVNKRTVYWPAIAVLKKVVEKRSQPLKTV